MEYDIESGDVNTGEYICSSCQLNSNSHCFKLINMNNSSLYFYFCAVDSFDLKDTYGLLNHLYGNLRYNKRNWVLLFDCFDIGIMEIFYLNKLKNLYNHYELKVDFTLLENIILLNTTFFNTSMLSIIFNNVNKYFKSKIIHDKNDYFKNLVEIYLNES